MANELKIPLRVNPNYNFSVDLEEHSYKFTIRWNGTGEFWVLNIEGITNNVVVNGIPMVTGPNLLKPFAIKELGAIYMVDLQSQFSDPNYDDIGTRFVMLYVPTTSPDSII